MHTPFPDRFFRLPLGSLRRSVACAGAAATLVLVPGAPAQTSHAPAEIHPAATIAAWPTATLHPAVPQNVADLEPIPLPASDRDSLPDAPRAAATDASRSSASESALAGEASVSAGLLADKTKAGHRYPATASRTDSVILPGQTAPRQTVRDKVAESVLNSISPFSIGGELISAGYSHATNGTPNYGTNSTAFAQRFGAAVARGTSQHLFYEGAMASILHEDPRYYKLGSSHPLLTRLIYAGTRPLITRTDSGKRTPNLALLSGYLGAAALTKVYYPPLNQGVDQTLITFGGSIGGAALGYETSEFLADALQILHLKHRQ